MRQLVIISPDTGLRGALCTALRQVKAPGRAVILRDYPPARQIEQLFGADPPNTALVGLSQPEQALGLIGFLNAHYPKTVVVAANSVNTPDLILAAVRAGACEYIGPPFQAADLESALSRQPVEVRKAEALGLLIAFLPAQGGSGASTAALHTAVALHSLLGKRVLLTDFDFQSGSLAFRLRLKPEFNFAHALERSDCLDELWRSLTCSWKGIDVLAAPPPPLPQEAGEAGRASAVFRSARKAYDCVIVDLPPAIHTSCREALAQARKTYIVCTPELVSLHLARRRAEELRDLGSAREAMALVLNRVAAQSSLSTAEVERVVGISVAQALRNDYPTVSAASLRASLVPEGCELDKQFRALAGMIAASLDPRKELS